MRYYLDCEFWGWRGDIISLALVGDDGREFYIAFDQAELKAEASIVTLAAERKWMLDNVLPVIDVDGASPLRVGKCRNDIQRLWPQHIAAFLRSNQHPITIVADWPEDIRLLCELLMTGPGEPAIPYPQQMSFLWMRCDAYPTNLAGAVQHNALWDARALRRKLKYQPSWWDAAVDEARKHGITVASPTFEAAGSYGQPESEGGFWSVVCVLGDGEVTRKFGISEAAERQYGSKIDFHVRRHVAFKAKELERDREAKK